jgi:hypothetical protein
MDAFLKETQAFSVLFRMGVLSRDEWREWLRQEYNVPLAPPVQFTDAVPDMSDITGLPDFVASLVDGRMTELFTAEEAMDGGQALVEAEMGENGAQADFSDEPMTDEILERLAQEADQ